MTIEALDYQKGFWHLQINGALYYFSCKPLMLFSQKQFLPLTPDCDNGLRWRIKKNWVSYLQIKSAIQNFKHANQFKKLSS